MNLVNDFEINFSLRMSGFPYKSVGILVPDICVEATMQAEGSEKFDIKGGLWLMLGWFGS